MLSVRDKIECRKDRQVAPHPFAQANSAFAPARATANFFRRARIWRIDLRPRNTLGFKQLAGSGASRAYVALVVALIKAHHSWLRSSTSEQQALRANSHSPWFSGAFQFPGI
jgi:hypothetical protein